MEIENWKLKIEITHREVHGRAPSHVPSLPTLGAFIWACAAEPHVLTTGVPKAWPTSAAGRAGRDKGFQFQFSIPIAPPRRAIIRAP
jgi:hypothetical protein